MDDKKFELKNRRYIGNKEKISSIIIDLIKNYFEDLNTLTFFEPFAGTAVVADYISKLGSKVIINDLLYSNYVIYKSWFSKERINYEKMYTYVQKMNNLNIRNIESNYFSKIYGGKYFSINDSKIIGFIRDKIEEDKSELTNREYFYLIASLIFSIDKIANTVGHFEHYLSKSIIEDRFIYKLLNTRNIEKTKVFNLDANILVKKIESDVVYIDPPYNARQYINFYHVLENLARWEKPNEFEGKSMKFKRNELKSGYSKSKAKILLQDLISSINSKLIIVSYSNTYNAKSSASNNKISENEIIEMLQKKGKVKIMEIPHKSFNTGKTSLENHKELLFICEVKK
jgi:adenine-specific DNA-methyltransferase